MNFVSDNNLMEYFLEESTRGGFHDFCWILTRSIIAGIELILNIFCIFIRILSLSLSKDNCSYQNKVENAFTKIFSGRDLSCVNSMLSTIFRAFLWLSRFRYVGQFNSGNNSLVQNFFLYQRKMTLGKPPYISKGKRVEQWL